MKRKRGLLISANCPCTSGIPYEDCCKPYHEGENVSSALKLMRSRFAAYAMGLVDYLIDTTHPLSPQYRLDRKVWKKQLKAFCHGTQFEKLEILDAEEREKTAIVSFRAHLMRDGEEDSFQERSFFEKRKGRWLYKAGLVGHSEKMSVDEILPLAYYGDPILERKGKPVEKIDGELKQFVEKMIQTMDFYSGIGLAAPQVHKSIQLFIIREPIEKESGEVDFGKVSVFINPKVKIVTERTWRHIEGCLSIPSVQAEVERPYEIEISYTDLQGKEKKERAKGWRARVILHENDHIEGILFPDRLLEEERKEIFPYLEALRKRINPSDG